MIENKTLADIMDDIVQKNKMDMDTKFNIDPKQECQKMIDAVLAYIEHQAKLERSSCHIIACGTSCGYAYNNSIYHNSYQTGTLIYTLHSIFRMDYFESFLMNYLVNCGFSVTNGIVSWEKK